MLEAGPHKTMIEEVTRLLHTDQLQDAANCWLDFVGVQKIKDDNPKQCYTALTNLLCWSLDNDAQEEAAQLLWSKNLFDPTPRCSQLVWDLYDRTPFGLLMGAGSMSKSYTMGVRLLLEWLRDPNWTTVRLLGPSKEHLEANLFSHLVSLHRGSKIPLPGQVGEMFIGMSRRDYVSSISGLVIPKGSSNAKSGKLQGTKRKPRPHSHPEFGPLSRLLIFLDEIENIPQSIWGDIDNLMSNLDSEESKGLRIFGAYNPTNRDSEVGKRAEPMAGWDYFDLDKDEAWTSKRGWEVVRLDALKSENVIEGKTIYPGLQTLAGVKAIERGSGGVESAGYYSMVRAAYPPRGTQMTVIPAGLTVGIKAVPIWYKKPRAVGSCDLALEGGAKAIFTKGWWGLATGVQYPLNPGRPVNNTKMFMDDHGNVRPRYVLYIEKQFALPRGKTQAMAKSVQSTCYSHAIRPGWLCVDRTGHGQGVADLLAGDWSPEVIAVNYSEATTGLKIMQEDRDTSKEMFDRINSELWFATKSFFEFGYLYFDPELDTTDLIPQLTTRLYRVVAGKSKVESKRDYIGRGNLSPDEADSLTLLVHTVRKASGVVPSMTGRAEDSSTDDENDPNMWPGGHQGQIIDATMYQESLE